MLAASAQPDLWPVLNALLVETGGLIAHKWHLQDCQSPLPGLCSSEGEYHHILGQVRRVPVVTRQIDLSELTVRQPKTEQMRTVEASLRLDAVASAGFRISRGKAADLIKHGDVRSDLSSTEPFAAQGAQH